MSAGNRSRRIGVILAAGRGSRMGSTKQLKLWPAADGPKPLICAAYDAIRPICDRIVAVLGHEAEKVAAALDARPFDLVLSSADVAMAQSICVGLRAAMTIDADAIVILQPGDHPEVAESTLQAMIAFSLQRPNQAVIPQYNGHGGHPALIPSVVVRAILDNACTAGLKKFWADHPELSCRLPVEDPAVTRDIDTPADLPS